MSRTELGPFYQSAKWSFQLPLMPTDWPRTPYIRREKERCERKAARRSTPTWKSSRKESEKTMAPLIIFFFSHAVVVHHCGLRSAESWSRSILTTQGAQNMQPDIIAVGARLALEASESCSHGFRSACSVTWLGKVFENRTSRYRYCGKRGLRHKIVGQWR